MGPYVHSNKFGKGGAMKQKKKKMIVACDCCEYSAQIFKYAVTVAKAIGSDIVVANVINQIALVQVEKALSVYESFDLSSYVTSLKNDHLAKIQALIKETGETALFKKTVFKTGIPFQALLEIIAEETADLLVMGNKGRGNLTGVLLGSCAQKMYRRCLIPLLSVRVDRKKCSA